MYLTSTDLIAPFWEYQAGVCKSVNDVCLWGLGGWEGGLLGKCLFQQGVCVLIPRFLCVCECECVVFKMMEVCYHLEPWGRCGGGAGMGS